MDDGTPGQEIDRVSTQAARLADSVELVEQAEQAVEAARRQAELIRRQSYEIERAARADLERAQHAMQMAKDTLDAIQLFEGLGESIEMIHDGEPASAATPWRIYERIATPSQDLTAIAMLKALDDPSVEIEYVAGAVSGIGSRDALVKWLSDATNAFALLTDQRQILCLAIPVRNTFNGSISIEHHIAIRNGGRVFLASPQVELPERISGFVADPALVNKLFTDRSGRAISPSDPDWAEAQKAAAKEMRPFFFIAFVMEGLRERTKVFDPMPSDGFSFVKDGGFDPDYIQVVYRNFLVVEAPGETLQEWQRRLAKEVREGCRVVLHDVGGNGPFHEDSWLYRPMEAHGSHPYIAELRRRPNGSHYVSWTEPAYTDWNCTGAPRKATFTIERPAGLLPLDHPDVNPGTMRRLLASAQGVESLGGFRAPAAAVIRFLQDEWQAERPFIELIAGVVADQLGTDRDLVIATVARQAVHWKVRTKVHRPLISPKGDDRAAFVAIRDVSLRALKAYVLDVDEPFVAELKNRPNAIWVGRHPNGDYVLITDEQRGFVSLTTFSEKRHIERPADAWRLPPDVAGWCAYWSDSGRWREIRASRYKTRLNLTNPAVETVVAEFKERHGSAEIIAVDVFQRTVMVIYRTPQGDDLSETIRVADDGTATPGTPDEFELRPRRGYDRTPEISHELGRWSWSGMQGAWWFYTNAEILDEAWAAQEAEWEADKRKQSLLDQLAEAYVAPIISAIAEVLANAAQAKQGAIYRSAKPQDPSDFMPTARRLLGRDADRHRSASISHSIADIHTNDADVTAVDLATIPAAGRLLEGLGVDSLIVTLPEVEDAGMTNDSRTERPD